MEKIKIQSPEKFSFYYEIPVRISDVNYGGHVGNDAFLSLVHEARLQFLASFGYSEISFEGVGLIMSDAAIEFKKELVYGDILKIGVTATGWEKFGFDIIYQIEKNNEGGQAILAAKVKTGMICFDYAKKKIAYIPETAKEKIKEKML